jgi:LmbE family N-acetylglucosaminyl deacetylase
MFTKLNSPAEGANVESAVAGRMAPRLLALVLLLPAVLAADRPLLPLPLDQGATGLALALRRLGVAGRVLYVTAHPDDDNNSVLVALSRGRGLRTGLLTLTRGEGGQNEIGAELSFALGVLRSEELAAVHRYDGADQLFGRAWEFGYSFSVEESFARWGREESLGDVVKVFRAYRPDVVLTLPLESKGGGQHHQAAARLAREAFRAAADPRRFLEHAALGLAPWQARKLYQGGVGGGALEVPGSAPVPVTTGTFDPLLGMTWHELGSLARASHRSQGLSQLKASPGSRQFPYFLVEAVPPSIGAEADILDGFDPSLSGLLRFAADEPAWLRAGLASLQVRAGTLQANFDPRSPQKSAAPIAELMAALRALRAEVETSGLAPEARAELAFRLADEEADASAALARAHGLAFEVVTDDGDVVPGQGFQVTATVWSQGAVPIGIEGVDLRVPDGWTAAPRPAPAGGNEAAPGVATTFEVRPPAGAPYSQPFWRPDPVLDRVDLVRPEHDTLPWSPPQVVARLRYTSHGVSTALEAPAVWRYEARGGGEKRKVVNVVPALSVRVTPAVTVIPVTAEGTRREVKVAVLSNLKGAASATVRLEAPPGWSVTPRLASLDLHHEGAEAAARFEVSPPPRPEAGVYPLQAVAEAAGGEFREGYRTVAYDHVEERHVFEPASARVLALDVRVAPGASVGYVMGAGDEVGEAIRQLGVPLSFLTADDLAFADLHRYTTIMTGIRAYQTRPDLRSYHARLMKYVESGGHLVVQYNKMDFNVLSEPPRVGALSGQTPTRGDSPFAPYPAAVTSARVTDEAAPVRLLVPESALLSAPNRLVESDWSGWVQERGLYFLEARDPRYSELLAMTDPFPLNPGEKRGALVEARVGNGTWTYVGLALFRQLPAGVPGAYRLLANLVSRPPGATAGRSPRARVVS